MMKTNMTRADLRQAPLDHQVTVLAHKVPQATAHLPLAFRTGLLQVSALLPLDSHNMVLHLSNLHMVARQRIVIWAKTA